MNSVYALVIQCVCWETSSFARCIWFVLNEGLLNYQEIFIRCKNCRFHQFCKEKKYVIGVYLLFFILLIRESSIRSSRDSNHSKSIITNIMIYCSHQNTIKFGNADNCCTVSCIHAHDAWITETSSYLNFMCCILLYKKIWIC